MMVSPRGRTITLLLAFFLGYLGIHRLYVGKWATALIWFLTGGVAGIGWIVDCIIIALSSFKDSEGNVVSKW